MRPLTFCCVCSMGTKSQSVQEEDEETQEDRKSGCESTTDVKPVIFMCSIYDGCSERAHVFFLCPCPLSTREGMVGRRGESRRADKPCRRAHQPGAASG